jgi:hypothetical protein
MDSVSNHNHLWTAFLALQHKYLGRNVVRILQRENKTLPIAINLFVWSLGRNSHSNRVKPPKIFPFVSKITVWVFPWLSHPQSNSFAFKSSRIPATEDLRNVSNDLRIERLSGQLRRDGRWSGGDEPGTWLGRGWDGMCRNNGRAAGRWRKRQLILGWRRAE